MTNCSVSMDELKHNSGEEPEVAYVTALDFVHEAKYDERFEEALSCDEGVIRALADLYRSKRIGDAMHLMRKIEKLVDRQTDGLEVE